MLRVNSAQLQLSEMAFSRLRFGQSLSINIRYDMKRGLGVFLELTPWRPACAYLSPNDRQRPTVAELPALSP